MRQPLLASARIFPVKEQQTGELPLKAFCAFKKRIGSLLILSRTPSGRQRLAETTSCSPDPTMLQSAAIIYSLFATCKFHDVNVFEWLKYVVTAMPTLPASRIKELLPQNWSQVIVDRELVTNHSFQY